MRQSVLMYLLFVFFSPVSSLICPGQISLIGAGSSFPAALYKELGSKYSAKRLSRGLEVYFEYIDRNSGYGMDRIMLRSPELGPVAFAATEWTLSKDQHRLYPRLKMFPMLAGALVVIHNVPSAKNESLTLTVDVFTKIYDGTIKFWDDPAIELRNKRISIGHHRIRVVARSDNSGDTNIFTDGLSKFSRNWGQTHGTFSNPGFESGICCNSSNWPSGVVEFFANRVNGMIGIVGSIPYTIGYAAQTNVIGYGDVKIAQLVNSADEIVQPNAESVHAAMNFHLSDARGSLVFGLNDARTIDAYPLASFSYLIVNASTHHDINCCQMQELVGFIRYVLDIEANVFSRYHLIPLSQSVLESVVSNGLYTVYCDGYSSYSNYKDSLEERFEFQFWHGLAVIFFLIMVALAAVTVVVLLKQRRDRRRSMNKWLLNGRIIFDFADNPATASIPRLTALKFFCQLGELDGSNKTLLEKLDITAGARNWSSVTKELANRFTERTIHSNVVALLGVAELGGSNYAVMHHASKGCLHYMLQSCRFELRDPVKFGFAHGAAHGMAFLHRSGVIHGLLSSITCFLDAAWTLKIGSWYHFNLMEKQAEKNFGKYFESNENSFSLANVIKMVYIDPNFGCSQKSACDLYSFGLLLVEIFTQKLPFDHVISGSSEEFAYFVQDKFYKGGTAPKNLLDFENIPENIAKLIESCIGPTNKRPTMPELCSVLESIIAGQEGVADAMMNSMESYTLALENTIEQQKEQILNLDTQLQRSFRQLLPPSMSEKLLESNRRLERFENATVCYLELRNVHELCARLGANEITQTLANLLGLMDGELQGENISRLFTTVDVCLFYSTISSPDSSEHCRAVAKAALDLSAAIAKIKIDGLPEEKLTFRAGMATGPVTCCVIGEKILQLCVVGKPVVSAVKLAHRTDLNQICVSAAAAQILMSRFHEFKLIRYDEDTLKNGKATFLLTPAK